VEKSSPSPKNASRRQNEAIGAKKKCHSARNRPGFKRRYSPNSRSPKTRRKQHGGKGTGGGERGSNREVSHPGWRRARRRPTRRGSDAHHEAVLPHRGTFPSPNGLLSHQPPRKITSARYREARGEVRSRAGGP